MKKSTLIAFGLIALLAGGSAHYLLDQTIKPAAAASTTIPAVSLPNTILKDLDGNPQNLQQWQGKIVILNFWATWCPPCRKEIPAFIELQEQLGEQGVQFVGVAVDNPKLAKKYSDEHGINYPNLQGDGAGLDLSITLGNRRSVLPYTVIFDRSGTIIDQHAGEMTHSALMTQLTPLL